MLQRELAASSLMQRSGIVSANGMDSVPFVLTLYILEGVYHGFPVGAPCPSSWPSLRRCAEAQGEGTLREVSLFTTQPFFLVLRTACGSLSMMCAVSCL